MKDVLVPVSPGELLDKITILRIKSARITRCGQARPHPSGARLAGDDLARQRLRGSGPGADERALQQVNERLWDIEDRIREKEAAQILRWRIHRARQSGLCLERRARGNQEAGKRPARLAHRRREILPPLSLVAAMMSPSRDPQSARAPALIACAHCPGSPS